MALQTSGAISLNQIHVEAGGSSGTQASINDSDIRGLISKGSGAQNSFSEYYGASSGPTYTDVLTMVAGATRPPKATEDDIGYSGTDGLSYGSLSPRTLSFSSGIIYLVSDNSTFSGFTFRVEGPSYVPANAFTKLDIFNGSSLFISIPYSSFQRNASGTTVNGPVTFFTRAGRIGLVSGTTYSLKFA